MLPAQADVLVSLVGDMDNFGYGGMDNPPCVFYDLSEPEDVGVFDRELTSGDEVDVWSHLFALPPGATINSATLDIPEKFSDFSASTLDIDGTGPVDFTMGVFTGCGPFAIHSFSVAPALLADGALGLVFAENTDNIALDYSLLTIDFTPAAAIPEPGSLTLLALGGLGMLGYRLRPRK
jgi:hypothetical protein